MSFKAIILLTRAESASHEDFAQWWLRQHAPLARQLPGLRRGVFNLVESPADGDQTVFPSCGLIPKPILIRHTQAKSGNR